MARAPSAREGCELGEPRGLRTTVSERRWEGAEGTSGRLGGLQLDAEGGGTVGEEQRRTHMGPPAAVRVVLTMGLGLACIDALWNLRSPGFFAPQQEVWVHPFPLGIESPHGHGGALVSRSPPVL